MAKKELILYLFFLSTISFAQKNGDGSYKPEWKRDTVIAGDVFKIYNSWVNGGAGTAINTKNPHSQFTAGLDFNFHITKQYFQTGLLLSGDAYGNYNNIQMHLAYGGRQENLKFNLAYFGGLSYASFYPLSKGKYALDPTKTVGLWANIQLIRKITYDVGAGLSAFADVNSKQSIFGVRLDLYFSGAYKGKKKSE